ncbi:MAG: hypothetical protein IJ565_00325 [Bacilli bacterium]|nr:hypothetical protein [Bacilli bacterium]
MDFFIAWLISIGLSITMDKSFELFIYKMIADYGYRSTTNTLKDLPKNIVQYDHPLFRFLPFINVFLRIYMYGQVIAMPKVDIIDLMREYDFITKMTYEEENEYKNNPNPFTSMKISEEDIYQESRKQSIKLTLNDDTETQIFYQVDEDNENIEVLNVKGALYKESDQANIKIIYEAWMELFNTGLKLCKDMNDLMDVLDENNHFSIENLEGNTTYKKVDYYYNMDELIKLCTYFNNTIDDGEEIDTPKIRKRYDIKK